MLTMTEQLRAKPGREAELAERLETLATGVRAEPGCHECRLARSKHDPRVFLVTGRYTDEAALDEHSRAAHYTQALPALMDCLEGPPLVALFEDLGSGASDA